MSFAEAVAERAGRDVDAVEAVLLAHGVQPQSTAAAPVPLVIDRLAFSGTKHRESQADEPFVFARDLGPGVWAVTSGAANLAGKSSVLFVIRWALTGRSHLTDDVEGWIERVELDGRVRDEEFTVRFSEGQDGLAGELVAGETLTPFDSSTFEEVMESFFLDRLRFDPTPFWQARQGGDEDEGDRRRFGWNGYFPALHLRAENLSVLLGDQVQGGHPGALMQVFLGLPWALTASSARVATREVQMTRSASARRRAEDASARERALEPVRNDLAVARQQLAALEHAHAPISANEADRRLILYSAALTRTREAQAAVDAARTALLLTQEDIDDATKRVQALEQSRVVRPLLGRLTPTMCPRCNVTIDEGRLQHEHDAHECSVCAQTLTDESQDEEEFDGAREAVRAAEEQGERAAAELRAAEQQLLEAREGLADAESSVRELEDQPAQTQTLELERLIARLEGRLEQAVAPMEPADPDEREGAYDVLRAAQAEAEARRTGAASELLSELGNEIAQLGRAFGIANLETASPRLNAQLALRVGGADSNFSSRTGGERLRLRIATVIGLLRVAERRGAGRHPGLLLIDSPGGEEMVEGDVRRILDELKTVCDELPALQVVCATARAEEVREALDETRIIHGPNYGEVW